MDKVEIKKCTRCGKEYPATTEFFHKKGDKLHAKCKNCRRELKREYLNKNKENQKEDIRFLMDKKTIEAFDKKAEEFHMSRTDFLKLMVVKAESEPLIKINPECFTNFNYQIMGIARNVNQIAYLCNKVVNVHKADVESLREELKDIRKWQSKLEKEFNFIDTSIKYINDVIKFDDI